MMWRLPLCNYDSLVLLLLSDPFFCLEFLRSLVDRGLLRHSLRQGSWEWDAEKIGLENTTDNVLYLLSSKMNGLTNEVQTVLKVLSCFGIKVNGNIITYLNSTSQYCDIIVGIEEARSSGFISLTGEPSCYSFAHDKVREAAYSLVPSDEKHEWVSQNRCIILFWKWIRLIFYIHVINLLDSTAS